VNTSPTGQRPDLAVPPRRSPDDPCPRLLVADHALILCTPDPPFDAVEELEELGEVAYAIYRLCVEQAQGSAPLVAMEIAARLSYPRAATAIHLSRLAYRGLVQITDPHAATTPDHLQEVLDALRA
jgi:hypothetical protein